MRWPSGRSRVHAVLRVGGLARDGGTNWHLSSACRRGSVFDLSDFNGLRDEGGRGRSSRIMGGLGQDVGGRLESHGQPESPYYQYAAPFQFR